MGGCAKGLLRGPDGRMLAERLRDVTAPVADVVLVGQARQYAALGLASVPDARAGIGPLGGLLGLLERANGGVALAIACDMPWVSSDLVDALLAAPSDAPIVAPKRGGRWEPLCARYDAARVRPLAERHADRGETSLQRLLDAAGACPLREAAYDPRELRDWDEPADLP